MNGQLKTKAKKTAFTHKTHHLSTTQQHNDGESRSRHDTLHHGQGTRRCDKTDKERGVEDNPGRESATRQTTRSRVTQHQQKNLSRRENKNTVTTEKVTGNGHECGQRGGGGGARLRKHGRVSMNDCLNFHFESRRFEREGHQRRHFDRRSLRHPPAFDREAFLQANFRFVVSDAVDITTFLLNPNRPFAWEDVLQVQMFATEEVTCPISLDSPPICPHITPCGHIFSFPSIMRHLMTTADHRSSALCPLCYAKFDAQMLRWIHLLPQKMPRKGEEWRFSLMRKTKNGIVPVCATGNETQKPAGTFSIVNDVRSHFLKVSSELAAAVLMIGEDPEMEVEVETCFECFESLCQRAKDFEQRRLQQLSNQGTIQKTEVQIIAAAEKMSQSIRQNFYRGIGMTGEEEQESHSTHLPTSSSHSPDWPLSRTTDIFDDDPWPEEEETEYLSFQLGSFGPSPFEDPSEQSVHEETSENTEVAEYFYQSEDGQWLFLDPVNRRCLMMHYGSANNFPHEIAASIVDINEVMQKRRSVQNQLPYLSHLPKQASLRLVEIDLTAQLPRQCLVPVFNKRSQERKRTQREKALALQQEKEKKGEDGGGHPSLDMKNMPRLTGSTSTDMTFLPVRLANASRNNSAFSFANVAKNGYAPRTAQITYTTNPDEGCNKGSQQQQGSRSRKKKFDSRKKKTVLFSNAVSRK